MMRSDNIVIYGVTSGYGQMAHLRYSREERKRHARIPPLATAASFGQLCTRYQDFRLQ